jgi:2-polyprenyl-3-methyl-5-hydroxy-6-metoxy-1,4-benzoquinol methylase
MAAAQAGGCRHESRIYRHRFTAQEQAARRQTWRILCRDFLQHFIDPDDVVMDVGAGDGLFITNIRARRRIAVDLAPEVLELGSSGIEVWQAPISALAACVTEPVDVIFMSNFLEHLPTKLSVLEVLGDCHELLRAGGRLMILQPNIRFVGVRYWDYIDHQIALPDRSLVEAVTMAGFCVERLIPRFLPYTARSRLSRLSALTGVYLRLPLLWRIFGQQMFLMARRDDARAEAS